MSTAVALSEQAGPARTLAVARLSLQDFRNYARLSLEIGSRAVVLHGPNGAGKTNLLEAVSLLAPGRGLRQAKLSELDRQRPGEQVGSPWSMTALVEGRHGPVEIQTGRDADADRRSLLLDGQTSRSAQALAETLSLIWLTPAMDRLFAEGASDRRRFLDRLVLAVDPEHARRVALYERTLRERSVLLRSGRADTAWLGALERRAAESGVAIVAARRELLAGLETVLAGQTLPFPRPRLRLADEIADRLDAEPAVEVEQVLAARLAASRGDDAQSGGASVGPHRADLEAVSRDTGEPARLASTGWQKAYLISIVLAEAALRRALHDDLPVLLLDEVAAHLDEGRRRALFDVLDDLGCQFWLTGTDHSIFAPLAGRARLFNVCEATLTADD